jgi:hypothetical protein
MNSAGNISGSPTVAGTFPFTVVVKDSASASASANLSINVVTAAPPTVSIDSPASGSTVSGTVVVSGVASDGLTISSVQVSVDGGTFANASGTSSWSFSLNSNSLPNGAHTLSAKVTDSGGDSATSSLVDVTVNNASTSTDCTLYASPSGSDSNSGSSPSAPKSFQGAANSTQPGSVVCLLGGTYDLSSTFDPPNSGSPSSWIVYKNYDSTPVNFVWTGAADAEPMFKVGDGSFPSGPAYIQFQGLNLNGSGTAADGFFCRGGHHARFIANSISDTGGSGIGSINCDYLTADHNLINHNGYIPRPPPSPSTTAGPALSPITPTSGSTTTPASIPSSPTTSSLGKSINPQTTPTATASSSISAATLLLPSSSTTSSTAMVAAASSPTRSRTSTSSTTPATKTLSIPPNPISPSSPSTALATGTWSTTSPLPSAPAPPFRPVQLRLQSQLHRRHVLQRFA